MPTGLFSYNLSMVARVNLYKYKTDHVSPLLKIQQWLYIPSKLTSQSLPWPTDCISPSALWPHFLHPFYLLCSSHTGLLTLSWMSQEYSRLKNFISVVDSTHIFFFSVCKVFFCTHLQDLLCHLSSYSPVTFLAPFFNTLLKVKPILLLTSQWAANPPFSFAFLRKV